MSTSQGSPLPPLQLAANLHFQAQCKQRCTTVHNVQPQIGETTLQFSALYGLYPSPEESGQPVKNLHCKTLFFSLLWQLG